MQVQSFTRYAGLAVLVGALACARNPEPGSDEAAAARDTTTADTLGADAQNQPGYRGMERDTAVAPTGEQPSDSFLDKQGIGGAQDTSGYSGMERPPRTNGQAAPPADTDTTGAAAAPDTTGAWGTDTTQAGDTTGYNPSQQPSQDTTSTR